MRGLRRRRDPEGRMSLIEHLRELRRRVLISLLAIVACSAFGWNRYQQVFDALVEPVLDANQTAQVSFQSLTDSFSIQLTVSLFVGAVVASPVWLYQTWAFVVPGLTRREKRTALVFLLTAVPLFLAGCFSAYLVLPHAVSTLLSFTPDTGTNILPAASYLSFVLKFILAFGVAFLMPVFLVALNAVHVLPARVMLRAWRPAVFLIFLFTAIMTPTPDPWTMILMALPMVALYFMAVGIAALVDRRRARAAPEASWVDVSDDEASTL